MSGDFLVVSWLEDDASSWWAEASDTVRHSILHSMAPTRVNDPAPAVIHCQGRDPWDDDQLSAFEFLSFFL